MINAAIIDDEIGNRQLLSGLIQDHCPTIQLVGEASNVTNGLELIEKASPNLIFLDIKMPGGSGFDLLDRLKNMHVDLGIIFTTAYDEFAIKAFRYAAIDYLLKPIHPILLQEAVNKAQKKIEKVHFLERYKGFLEIFSEQHKKVSSMVLPSNKGFQKIDIGNIIRCEADRNYTLVYLKNSKPFMATKSLKEFDELLTPLGFFRVHQSHLINLSMFSSYYKTKDASGGIAELVDGSRVEVSRSKKKVFLDLIHK